MRNCFKFSSKIKSYFNTIAGKNAPFRNDVQYARVLLLHFARQLQLKSTSPVSNRKTVSRFSHVHLNNLILSCSRRQTANVIQWRPHRCWKPYSLHKLYAMACRLEVEELAKESGFSIVLLGRHKRETAVSWMYWWCRWFNGFVPGNGCVT